MCCHSIVPQPLQAGALAVIVADDGGCGESFDCGPRIGSRSEGQGLAAFDSISDWRAVRIPVVMITAAAANRVRAQLTAHGLLQSVHTAEFGTQKLLLDDR